MNANKRRYEKSAFFDMYLWFILNLFQPPLPSSALLPPPLASLIQGARPDLRSTHPCGGGLAGALVLSHGCIGSSSRTLSYTRCICSILV